MTADVSLAQKLQAELQFEQDAAEEGVPEFLKQVQEEGIWTVGFSEYELDLTCKRANALLRTSFSLD